MKGSNATDVLALQRTFDASDPDGTLAPIGMSRIEIDRSALNLLPEVVSSVTRDGRVVVLMDGTPMRRNGDELKPMVEAMLASTFEVEVCVLDAADGELHADEHAIAQAAAALERAGCVVAVGSGTVTDIAKEASARAGSLPLIVVQTAASVNAFSDNMAVLLQSGVKRTLPSRWPDVLLADLEILGSAPAAMNLAGFGDLMAVWTAPADWRLAHLVGMDPSYHPAPVRLLREDGEQLLKSASGLSRRDPAALDRLATTLTLSGIALGVSGSTAPLSGTEHLISHLIDMHSARNGRALSLHGAQVGLAAVIAAALWERFLKSFDPAAVDVDRLFPAEGTVRAAVEAAFADLDPTGGIGRECWTDCRQKLAKWNECHPRVAEAIRDWELHRNELAAALRPPSEIARALREAGAVSTFAELEPPLPLETVRWAMERLPFMRARFTLADLLFYSGSWGAELVDDVLVNLQREGSIT
jgi:glycerol-1-phosphate dehydrogenase [NAD(P)+]